MPQFIASDSDSEGDVIVPKSSAKKATPASGRRGKKQEPEVSPEPKVADAGDDEDDDEDDDGGDEEEEEEEYVVEKITDHKFEGKKLFFHVKWKGYEKKSDMTWEPEENCSGAQEAVEEYFHEIGGRPKQPSPAKATKRNRTSTVGTDSTPAGKPKRARKSMATSNDGDAMEIDDKKWTPPNTKSWEDDVTAIDTIEKNTDGQLVCFVQWKDGKKSQHPIQDIYKKCPQRMLHFYEQHLVFKETGMMQQ